ncbi:hypothetical protein [Legionella impletisoli]|uniref:Outer membrane protein beta-barrel domain-containing protein n=1 Tax=Legionella impletisoli TaxID=343510 RepID=A0A917JX31_9GAMM|nr:hypothetical protein [Legionella impletisoli]GGI86213.1 hypothetical protein GCM10007966_13520 [Legionella impletisoli]
MRLSIHKFFYFICLLVISTQVFPLNLKEDGHVIVQAGGYWSSQGKSQHINIIDLIGDDFTVTRGTGSNGLMGLGYFIDGQSYKLFKMAFGVNAFYLAKTSVQGTVVQENLFTNLSYRYDVEHFPIYASAKSLVKTNSPKFDLVMELGFGPNFMRTSHFEEQSLDGGITLVDNIFSGRTTTTWSAMGGVGFKLNDLLGRASLECGYKLFYLGEGSFNRNSDQVLNTLHTGNSYANAFVCGVTL